MKFIKYYFNQFFNYLWTATTLFASLNFIREALIKDNYRYYALALIPLYLLVFNIITEYDTFKNNTVISQKLMINITAAISAITLLLLALSFTI